MSTTHRIDGLISKLSESLKDSDKFDSGNDAAGRRLRKVCAEVGKTCKELRVDIQQIRNTRKG